MSNLPRLDYYDREIIYNNSHRPYVVQNIPFKEFCLKNTRYYGHDAHVRYLRIANKAFMLALSCYES